MATTPAAVPYATSSQAQTSKPCASRMDASTKPKALTTAYQPHESGPSSPHLGAPVGVSTKDSSCRVGSPKEETTTPLKPRRSQRPSDPPQPSRWELAANRVRGRFSKFISHPTYIIENLPRQPPGCRERSGARYISVVRAFAHGAMGRRIDPV